MHHIIIDFKCYCIFDANLWLFSIIARTLVSCTLYFADRGFYDFALLFARFCIIIICHIINIANFINRKFIFIIEHIGESCKIIIIIE